MVFGLGGFIVLWKSHNAAQFNLTQSNEAKYESQQEQGEEEKAQQPLPPGATRVRTAAQSSTSEDAAVPVNFYRKGDESEPHVHTRH